MSIPVSPGLRGWSLNVQVIASNNDPKPIRTFAVFISPDQTISDFCEEAATIHLRSYGTVLEVQKCQNSIGADLMQNVILNHAFENREVIRIVKSGDGGDILPPNSIIRHISKRKRDTTSLNESWNDSSPLKRQRISARNEKPGAMLRLGTSSEEHPSPDIPLPTLMTGTKSNISSKSNSKTSFNEIAETPSQSSRAARAASTPTKLPKLSIDLEKAVKYPSPKPLSASTVITSPARRTSDPVEYFAIDDDDGSPVGTGFSPSVNRAQNSTAASQKMNAALNLPPPRLSKKLSTPPRTITNPATPRSTSSTAFIPTGRKSSLKVTSSPGSAVVSNSSTVRKVSFATPNRTSLYEVPDSPEPLELSVGKRTQPTETHSRATRSQNVPKDSQSSVRISQSIATPLKPQGQKTGSATFCPVKGCPRGFGNPFRDGPSLNLHLSKAHKMIEKDFSSTTPRPKRQGTLEHLLKKGSQSPATREDPLQIDSSEEEESDSGQENGQAVEVDPIEDSPIKSLQSKLTAGLPSAQKSTAQESGALGGIIKSNSPLRPSPPGNRAVKEFPGRKFTVNGQRVTGGSLSETPNTRRPSNTSPVSNTLLQEAPQVNVTSAKRYTEKGPSRQGVTTEKVTVNGGARQMFSFKGPFDTPPPVDEATAQETAYQNASVKDKSVKETTGPKSSKSKTTPESNLASRTQSTHSTKKNMQEIPANGCATHSSKKSSPFETKQIKASTPTSGAPEQRDSAGLDPDEGSTNEDEHSKIPSVEPTTFHYARSPGLTPPNIESSINGDEPHSSAPAVKLQRPSVAKPEQACKESRDDKIPDRPLKKLKGHPAENPKQQVPAAELDSEEGSSEEEAEISITKGDKTRKAVQGSKHEASDADSSSEDEETSSKDEPEEPPARYTQASQFISEAKKKSSYNDSDSEEGSEESFDEEDGAPLMSLQNPKPAIENPESESDSNSDSDSSSSSKPPPASSPPLTRKRPQILISAPKSQPRAQTPILPPQHIKSGKTPTIPAATQPIKPTTKLSMISAKQPSTQYIRTPVPPPKILSRPSQIATTNAKPKHASLKELAARAKVHSRVISSTTPPASKQAVGRRMPRPTSSDESSESESESESSSSEVEKDEKMSAEQQIQRQLAKQKNWEESVKKNAIRRKK